MQVKGLNGQLELTDTHVIIRRKGIMATLSKGLAGEKSIPIDSITSVQFKPGGLLWNGFIKFCYPGSDEIRGGLSAATKDDNAVIFTGSMNAQFEEFRRRLEEARTKQRNGAAPARSVAEEIEKLAELRDKGLITDEEFESKKKELLARM